VAQENQSDRNEKPDEEIKARMPRTFGILASLFEKAEEIKCTDAQDQRISNESHGRTVDSATFLHERQKSNEGKQPDKGEALLGSSQGNRLGLSSEESEVQKKVGHGRK